MTEIKCPHCVHGTQHAQYAPTRGYPCEDCRGSCVLRVCAVCNRALGLYCYNGDADTCSECEEAAQS